MTPWTALPSLAAVAACLERPLPEVEAEARALPSGIYGVALLDGERVLAAALVVDKELARTGRRGVARLRSAPGSPAEAALPLLAELEEGALREGAATMRVTPAEGAGMGAALLARGYALTDAFVVLRRAPLLPRGAALPPGFAEAGLEALTEEAFVELHNDAFAGVPAAVALAVADLRRLFEDPRFTRALVRVVFERGAPVGFLRVSLRDDGEGEIEEIGLVPRARGRGLGRWLLHRAERLLAAEGVVVGRLLVAASNEPALRLYLSEGYEERSRRGSYERRLA